MKVICIDDKHRPKDEILDGWQIKEGEVYTVVESFVIEHKIIFYCLSEDTDRDENGERFGFESDRFIPLSEIDETKLVNLQTIEQ